MASAFRALVAVDADAATKCGFRMFDGQPADRLALAIELLSDVTGAPVTVERLIAELGEGSNLVAMLRMHALAAHGEGIVAPLIERARQLTSGNSGDPTWFDDERVRYYIASALGHVGPAAHPAIPLLVAWLTDTWHYRDTPHASKCALVAIGASSANALVENLVAPHEYAVLDALGAFSDDVLSKTRGLSDALRPLAARPDETIASRAADLLERVHP